MGVGAGRADVIDDFRAGLNPLARVEISAGGGRLDHWLEGTVEQARALMRLAPTEVYDAGPMEPEQPTLV